MILFIKVSLLSDEHQKGNFIWRALPITERLYSRYFISIFCFWQFFMLECCLYLESEEVTVLNQFDEMEIIKHSVIKYQ